MNTKNVPVPESIAQVQRQLDQIRSTHPRGRRLPESRWSAAVKLARQHGIYPEPNSGLGKAITYLLRHWRPLTAFLRVAGTPLDNNIVERALKRAVVHRKNALFYRTLNGVQLGDLFMSLVHTCQLCGANSFDYLTELQRHAHQVAANPAEWMPWNYRTTLARGCRSRLGMMNATWPKSIVCGRVDFDLETAYERAPDDTN